MKSINIYIIRDEVAQDNSVIVTASNDEDAKRNIKLALCSRERNFVNTHTKDKRLVFTGSLDLDTGVITSEANPVPLFTIEEIRLELVHEIAVAKSQALSHYLQAGIKKEDIQAAKDLLTTLALDFDFDKAIIADYKKSVEFSDLVNEKVNALLNLHRQVEGSTDGKA